MCIKFTSSEGVINMYYIYKIENLKNSKKYIGLTNNPNRRISRHFTDLKFSRHDNQFLQKEYNIYGRSQFSVEIVFEGDVSEQEIGEKEREFIKLYDSYHNGYNQNEGGNFGASNGGSQLTKTDIFNILAVLEYMSRPGQVLADIYGVSRTTISRIKRGVNHTDYKREFDALKEEDKKELYNNFLVTSNLYEKKVNSTIIQSKRKLNEEQVHLILLNFERKLITQVDMAKRVGIKSTYTLDCIKKGKTYQDFALTYTKLNEDQKEKLASLLSNQQKQTH